MPPSGHALLSGKRQFYFEASAVGADVLAYLVEHKNLHDARRSEQERGEDMQYMQQDVHRVTNS